MSGGQKQLLNLARILYANPNFLILDEATSNLDYKMEEKYFSILNKLNITTLIIAHNKNILKYCNRIILIENGKIVDEGNNSYFEKKYDNLKKLYKLIFFFIIFDHLPEYFSLTSFSHSRKLFP